METKKLIGLNNPDNIVSFLHKNGNHIILDENQGFNVTNKTIEIWGRFINGGQYRVTRFNKSSVAMFFYN